MWNPGPEPVNVQVRILSWRNDGEEDSYQPSDDVGFSPPLFSLASQGRQTVRFAWRGPPPERELSYRMFIDQLPQPDTPGVVQLPVRMVLPLFVEPAGPGQGQLNWRLQPQGKAGEFLLVAENRGGRRVRLRDLGLLKQGAVQPIRAGLAGYVLAGQSMAWRLELGAAPPANLSIRARSDEGDIAADLPLPRP